MKTHPINIPFNATQLSALIEHLEGDDAPVMPSSVAKTCDALKAALELAKTPTPKLANNHGDVALKKAVVLLHADAPELSSQLKSYLDVKEESTC